MKFNERGEELPDDTPVEMPLGFKRPPSLQEMIAQAIRTHVSDVAAAQGLESFEEANDFGDEDEDPLPFSPHEVVDMQEEAYYRDRSNYERNRRRSRKDGEGGRSKVDADRRAGDRGKSGSDGRDVSASAGKGEVGPRSDSIGGGSEVRSGGVVEDADRVKK